MDQDGSVVLAGYGGEESSTYVFSVVKLDADGSLLWQFQVRVVMDILPWLPQRHATTTAVIWLCLLSL